VTVANGLRGRSSVSDWFSDFISLTPHTAAGDWGWVALAWGLTVATFVVYQLSLSRRRQKLRKEHRNQP